MQASNKFHLAITAIIMVLVAMTMGYALGVENKTTKDYLLAAANSGVPQEGVLVGSEFEAISQKTGSKEPVRIRVERIEDIIGVTENDSTCGRYRVSYFQSGVKDTSGNAIQEPLTFGFDINICGDGRPAIAEAE